MRYKIIAKIQALFSRSRPGIFENKDDGVATQEHFADESFLVGWLGLLLAFSRLGRFGPHLLDVLQNHVAVAIERFDAAKKFLVVSAIDQDLSVVFHR